MHFYLDHAFADHLLKLKETPQFKEATPEEQRSATAMLNGRYHMVKDRFRVVKELYSKRRLKRTIPNQDLFLQQLFPNDKRYDLLEMSYPGLVYKWLATEYDRLLALPLSCW